MPAVNVLPAGISAINEPPAGMSAINKLSAGISTSMERQKDSIKIPIRKIDTFLLNLIYFYVINQ